MADHGLNLLDEYLLTPYVYPESWGESWWVRQTVTLFFAVWFGATSMYLITATFCYYFIFDHRLMQHPKFLKNQVRREISLSMYNLFFEAVQATLVFLAEVRGYSMLYDGINGEGYVGWIRTALDLLGHIFFTDMGIYWIHRWMHHPQVYKHIHKHHHQWKVPSPFASHSLHPLDTILQTIPFHVLPFIIPLNKMLYLTMFTFVSIWSVSIHDGDFRVPDPLKPYINGSAHHTDHHLYFNYNYGQYFTLWDRIGGSFRTPSAYEGDSPLDQVLKLQGDRINGNTGPQHRRKGEVYTADSSARVNGGCNQKED